MAMRGEIATHPVISKDEMYRINTSGKHYINALQNRQSIKLVHEMSSLNEQHLVIAAADIAFLLSLRKNETGYTDGIDGPLADYLNWISAHFNFTYSLLQVNDTSLDPSKGLPGLISYVTHGVSDLLLAPVSANPQRVKKMDFIQPYHISEAFYLMPSPKSSSTSLSALIKPFDGLVWMYLGVSFFMALFTVCLVNWYLAHTIGINPNFNKARLKNAFVYVSAMLLRQPRAGDSSGNKSLLVHLIAGTWCVATFILTNFYSSLLISYVTMPNSELMIKSVKELPQHPNIRILMDIGVEDYVDPSSENTALLKYIFDRFRSDYESSSCSHPLKCADKVKNDGSAVYITDKNVVLRVIGMDFKATKKCNFRKSHETFMTLPTSWTLPKGSRYLEDFNKGIMMLNEYGLTDTRNDSKRNVRIAQNCQRMTKYNRVAGLTLKNLTPVFLVQLIGVFLALFALFLEFKIAPNNSNGHHTSPRNSGKCRKYCVIFWI